MTKNQLKITRFMRKNKLTQAELSRMIHVSPQIVSDWVKGKRNPKDSTIFLLNLLQKDIDKHRKAV